MVHYKWQMLAAVALLLMLFVPATAWAQEIDQDLERDKLAQTSFKFLKISPDARAAALGDAMTSIEMGSSMAMFYNPAGMARLKGRVSAGFSITNWIADINYNAASLAINTGRFGVVGFSLISSDYGDDFIGTVAATNEAGFLEYSELGLSNPSPSSLAFGLGYAIAITDRFAVGANIKFAEQDLGEALVADGEIESNSESTLAYDFGVLYDTGFRSLKFALSVRNFSQELSYVNENFELPLTFNVGISMDMTDLMASVDPSTHSFNLMLEAERPRDFSEQLKIGGEYMFANILALRAGYVFPTDEQGVNLGAGLNYSAGSVGLGVDYAYTSFGVFDSVQRLAVNLSF